MLSQEFAISSQEFSISSQELAISSQESSISSQEFIINSQDLRSIVKNSRPVVKNLQSTVELTKKGPTSVRNSSNSSQLTHATFSELSIVSSHEKGVTVSMRVMRNGTYVSRSFRPDFVLTRERIRGVEPKADAKHLLFGLMHGNIPALNSLEATYSFMEKPLMYAQLTKIQKQFGAEEFPLIDQTYYQSYSEMVNTHAIQFNS
eukprot:gene6773-7536_t